MRCPYCGLTLIESGKVLICVIHGIVESSELSNQEDTDYIG